jgi:hypothetical protein
MSKCAKVEVKQAQKIRYNSRGDRHRKLGERKIINDKKFMNFSRNFCSLLKTPWKLYQLEFVTCHDVAFSSDSLSPPPHITEHKKKTWSNDSA